MILRLMWFVMGFALIGCCPSEIPDWQQEDIVAAIQTLGRRGRKAEQTGRFLIAPQPGSNFLRADVIL